MYVFLGNGGETSALDIIMFMLAGISVVGTLLLLTIGIMALGDREKNFKDFKGKKKLVIVFGSIFMVAYVFSVYMTLFH